MSIYKRAYIVLLLLLISQMAISQKDSFTNKNTFSVRLLNSTNECINDAIVTIGGKKAAAEDSKGIYSVDTLITGYTIVEINKEGYEPLNEKVLNSEYDQPKLIYLIKKGEPYYYQLGLKIPYVGNRRLLFVCSKDCPKTEDYLNSIHLKYLRYPKYIRGNYDTHMDSTIPALKNTLIIYKQDSTEFPEANCVELKNLRENKSVGCAGPIIAHTLNFQPAYTYTNTFLVEIYPDKSAMESSKKGNYNKFVQYLQGIGINEKEVHQYYKNQYLIILDDKSINDGIIEKIEKIKANDIVKMVDSQVISYVVED